MEEEQERAWADPSKRGVPSPRSDQPWHNASMYYSSEQEERAARRRCEYQSQEDGLKMSTHCKSRHDHQLVQEGLFLSNFGAEKPEAAHVHLGSVLH